MTVIVSEVIKFVFGFLANKARSRYAERLRDGDLKHEECRRLIARELNNVKTKLDGLATADLVQLSFSTRWNRRAISIYSSV